MINGLPFYTIAVPPPSTRSDKILPIDNFLLMSREKFKEWLDENNASAKPIDQLIEEFRFSKYEDHRPSLTK